MRIISLAAGSTAALFVALAFVNLHAQGQAPARGGSPAANNHGIAVVDINYIFEKYALFQQRVDGWKRDSEAQQAQFKKEDEAIAKQIESIKTLKPGTKEFKSKEEEITRQRSDFQINASLKEKEFKERAAKLQITAYQEITEAVKTYADRNGISLVLQFNGAPVDANNPRAVQMELSKLVVYQNGIDITPIILDDLNRRGAAAARPANRPGANQQPIKR